MGKKRKRLNRPGHNPPSQPESSTTRSEGGVPSSTQTTSLVAVALVVAVMVVFAQTAGFDFVTFDDPTYVTENPVVQRGLSGDGLSWALTTFHANNWHPLTWLSHMVDCQLFGLDAGMHHVTNVVLHAMAAVLLLVAFVRMTGSVWPSAMTAALFAVHPLRAESVAWVAERKDVLSIMLAMLLLVVWSWYVERPGPGRYLVAAAVFALGLTAKPMLVTLPFVLILLDIWPLTRIGPIDPSGDGIDLGGSLRRAVALGIEKLPLIAMAVASSVVTVMAQRSAMGDLEELPFAARLGNAVVSWVAYVVKSLIPTKLAFFYPHPAHGTPWWLAAAAGVMLVVVTVVVLRELRRRPYLAVGWFWYLGTLLPVIGVVQVGSQAMADRYSYLPQIGLWLMLAWGLVDLVTHRPRLRPVVVTSVMVLLVASAGLAWRQTGTWSNSATLYRQALAVTEDNWVAHANYAEILIDSGHLEEAVGHAARSLEINPENYAAAVLLGKSLSALGRTEEAVETYALARRLRPDLTLALFNLGNAYKRTGDVDRAISIYREVLAEEPDHIPARNNLGVELLLRDQPDAAAEVLCAAEAADASDLNLQFNCALAWTRLGRFEEAVDRFRRATSIDPRHAASWRGLTYALIELGRRDEAAQALDRAIGLDPGNQRSLQLEQRLEQAETSRPVDRGEEP